jgi:dTDP-4-amino-4,6-dideoxygalactose transaminase
MPDYRIPFNRPACVGAEQEYMSEALASGHISGDGLFTKKCQAFLENVLGVKKALLTTSCTHALEMAALLLAFQPGEEVIIPSFTFVSTANAFVLHGARPLFIDIRPDTLNLDETLLEKVCTKKTRAVVPVHYAGVGCEMDAIREFADRRGLAVIEDNAHGLFGKYKQGYLGTFGALSTLSFHETKNFTCGEGGAILINDPRYIVRAEIIREKGTNRSRFFRGEVDKYTWLDLGSSYLPSDILAAFLFGQFESRQIIQAKRKEIWESYADSLKDWARGNSVRLPVIPDDCQQSYHMFYLLLPTPAAQKAFIKHLKEHSILSVFHYLPLHLSAMGARFGGKVGDCPVTEDLSRRLVRLPFYNGFSPADRQDVVEAIRDFSA